MFLSIQRIQNVKKKLENVCNSAKCLYIYVGAAALTIPQKLLFTWLVFQSHSSK